MNLQSIQAYLVVNKSLIFLSFYLFNSKEAKLVAVIRNKLLVISGKLSETSKSEITIYQNLPIIRLKFFSL